jgi:hypothetical protein
MILFFRENESRDFLAIDTETNAYDLENFRQDHFEGRATAIAGLVGSVSTTGVSRDFLQTKCKRVPRRSVPQEWRRAIGYGP